MDMKTARQRMIAWEKEIMPTLGAKIEPKRAISLCLVFASMLPFIGCSLDSLPKTKYTISDNKGWKWEITRDLPPGYSDLGPGANLKYGDEFEQARGRIAGGSDTVTIQIQYGDTTETIIVTKEKTVKSEK